MRAVLMYHSIDGSGSPISIDAASFERHIAWMTSGAVRVLPLERLLDDEKPGHAVALTFDDAFQNFATDAWPRLRAHGLPATLYVVTDRVGTTNRWGGASSSSVPELPLADWATLGRLAEEGCDIGSHSRTHAHLSRLDEPALESEIVAAADELERRIGKRPSSFAYPYGDFGGSASTIVRRHHAIACTTVHDFLHGIIEPHLLPRIETFYFRGPDGLSSFGTKAFANSVKRRRFLRRLRVGVRHFFPSLKG